MKLFQLILIRPSCLVLLRSEASKQQFITRFVPSKPLSIKQCKITARDLIFIFSFSWLHYTMLVKSPPNIHLWINCWDFFGSFWKNPNTRTNLNNSYFFNLLSLYLFSVLCLSTRKLQLVLLYNILKTMQVPPGSAVIGPIWPVVYYTDYYFPKKNLGK